MKMFIILLAAAAFLQSTIVPIDLVLLLLLSRAFLTNDLQNLYLAFGMGLLIDLLQFTPMGSTGLIYLVAVVLTYALSRSRVFQNSLLLLPWTVIVLLLSRFVQDLLSFQSFVFNWGLIFQSILVLPIFYILRFWEERFVAHSDIKLKIKS